MSQSIKDATKYIEQGHVRVGPEVVKDPAFLVNRSLEDFVTWVDGSAIKKHVMEYNEMVCFLLFYEAVKWILKTSCPFPKIVRSM